MDSATTLTPDELNRRLAGLLGVDLTAQTIEDRGRAILAWGFQGDMEAFISAWRRDPPDYSGDIAIAFELGTRLAGDGLGPKFIYHLRAIVGHSLPCDAAEFLTAHASAYDRSLAAYRALGGEEE